MPSYSLVVMTNAKEGQDWEYNQFCEDQHIGDLLSVPGVVSARRYKVSDIQRENTQPAPYRYLCIYEIETENLRDVADEISRRSGTDLIRSNPFLGAARLSYFFEPISHVQGIQKTSKAANPQER